MTSIITKEKTDDMCFIGYYPNCFSEKLIESTKKYLKQQKNFLGGVSGWGKEIPRLQKWHQMQGYDFSYNWKTKYPRWKSFEYDSQLIEIQNQVEKKTREITNKKNSLGFNSCLINYYRDKNDSIKPHFDSMDNFGSRPLISILSIGSPRDIVFTRRIYNNSNPKSLKLDKFKHLNTTINLKEGSLLIMSGDTQKYYVHSIPKTSSDVCERYSLTFRKFIFN